MNTDVMFLGAIQLACLLPELKRQSQEVGVVSMCIGKLVTFHLKRKGD